jgi:hypothetical protein
LSSIARAARFARMILQSWSANDRPGVGVESAFERADVNSDRIHSVGAVDVDVREFATKALMGLSSPVRRPTTFCYRNARKMRDAPDGRSTPFAIQVL